MRAFRALLPELRGATFSVALASLAACSTLPNSHANFAPELPKPGYAALYIGRPFGGETSIFAVPIEVDRRPLVSLGPNDYTRIELSPGPHTVGVPDTYWTRAINSIPHPVKLTIEPGKSYYLLPTRWEENERMEIAVVGRSVVPTTTADGHSSFSVQAIASSGGEPPEFRNLTYVAPTQN